MEEIKAGRIWFGKDGKGVPRKKTYLSERQGQNSWSWWSNSEVGHNQEAKKEVVALFGPNSPFDTPKPERLIQRVLQLATNPGGITEAVGWKGGGGFRYYRLAPSLLEKDKWGQWVISKEFNAAMLAEAACKLEGFTFAPSETLYWQHGHSTERDFIYVTTQHLSADQLAQLSDEVGPDRSLLVLCAAFRVPKSGTEHYPNLTVKKIPKQLLSRCEWGHDDYSLKVENLPQATPKLGQMEML